MKVPWWTRWVIVGPLIRPGDEDDLPAIEWIVSKSPNPNSQSIRWWVDQFEQALATDDQTVNLTQAAFWVLASYTSRNPSLLFRVAKDTAVLDEVEWNFVLPVGPTARAILMDDYSLLPYAADVPMVGSFWSAVKEMSGPKTQWNWSWRKPRIPTHPVPKH